MNRPASGSVSPAPRPWPIAFAIATFAFLLVWFGPLEYRNLVKPDEGRYAEIAREMAASGDWITPRLNAVKYFEKPPLQYWATAAAYKLFGVHHWTARLWAALTGFFGILAVWFTGRRVFGPESGLISALVAAGCVYYAALGHINTLDMGLAFFTSLALFAFVLAQQARSRPEALRWMILSWGATAFAVLSKGLVAILLPAVSLVAYSAIARDRSPWRRLFPLRGTLLLLAIAAPWFVAVSIVNPEFPRFFFIHEHFERYLTTAHHRDHPWWFFLPILLAGLLPWTTAALAAWKAAWRDTTGASAAFDPGRFLAVYCAVILLFFSASGSKLPSYILPMFAPLALLTGPYLARAEPRSLQWHALPMLAAAILMLVLTPSLVHVFRPAETGAQMYESFGRWIQAAGAVGVAAALGALWLALRGKPLPAIISIAAGGLLASQVLMLGHDRLSPLSSSHAIARRIAADLQADAPFFNVRTYDHTLPFYLRRTFTLVEYGDEFEFGLQQQPDLALPTLEAFRTEWLAVPQAYALMGPDTFELLSQQHLPMREIARDPRRVIVARQ